MPKYRPRHVPRYHLKKSDKGIDLKRPARAVIEAWRKAFAPYSNFRVGAALVTRDGSLFLGSNVECADYDGTHAEESALSAMVQGGKQDPSLIFIVGGLDESSPTFEPVMPCGKCRQKLMEFVLRSGEDIKIITSWDDEHYEYVLLGDLLPDTFTLNG